MREVRLHDTRSGSVQALEPREPDRVGIYACGPTVYGRIHLGNARPFVIFSLMKRFLEHEGFDVTLVINITDVNDKIYDAAQSAGRPSAELAREMTDAYIADTDALGLGRPDHEPLASESMELIVAYIQALIDSEHAYAAPYEGDDEENLAPSREGRPALEQDPEITRRADVFFRVRSDQGYGSLSHRRLEDMDQGDEVEGSQRKQDPLDFSLWKARKPQEDTFWSSPWGEGRPGWHIECSAMAEGLLGLEFDIHGGGSDLVFPHHENEAAQTRAARGLELARMWVHNGMVQFTGEKMAKSVGNIAPLHEVLDRYGRDAVVLYLASGHYRQPLSFSEAALEQARANVSRIREAGRRLEPGASPPGLTYLRERFFDALADDFNTPEAIRAMNEWIRKASAPGNGDEREEERRGQPDGRRPGKPGDEHLREMLDALGLADLLAPAREAPAEVKDLVSARETARAKRDFKSADRLREEIAALGFEVRDGPYGPELIPRSP